MGKRKLKAVEEGVEDGVLAQKEDFIFNGGLRCGFKAAGGFAQNARASRVGSCPRAPFQSLNIFAFVSTSFTQINIHSSR